MSAGQGRASIVGPPPPMGICPSCGKEAGGERCVHCGVAARVGPYRVRKVLGQRDVSRTYLADDVDGLVVLKELSFSTTPAQATLQAFHQEARVLQGLTHPRIPRYLDMLQLGVGAETRLYLAQEFIEGTPLEQELSGRRYTEMEARELARQVLDILCYLQGRTPQVFHGDLKPANLIRRPDGALFLVDFGGAWVTGGAGSESTRYMPPEQLAGELDPTTDLYALGVTLVDALSWEPEWKRRKAGQEGALASQVDVSAGFRHFLARLTVEKELRFASPAEALRELEASERAPLVQPSRSRAWPVTVGTGAALLLFGAGVVTGRVTQKPTPVVQKPMPPVRAEPCFDTKDPHWNRPNRDPTVPPRGRVIPPPPEPTPMIQPGKLSRPVLTQEPGQRVDQIDSVNSADVVDDSANTVALRRTVSARWTPNHQPRDCELAAQGTVSASESWRSRPPEAAIDHDLQTLWQSDGSQTVWLEVDLTRSQLIDAVVLDWGWDTAYDATRQASVMTSEDGQHWTTLHTMINKPSEHDRTRTIRFPPQQARYVRFVGASWNDGRGRVRSLEVYGPACSLNEPEL
jgi:serine/threonine protein kinase